MFEVVLMIGFLWAGLCRLGLDDGGEEGGMVRSDQSDPVQPPPTPSFADGGQGTTGLFH